jgi:hypothetical protein
MARQSEYGIRPWDLNDDCTSPEGLAASKVGGVARESSSGAPAEVEADSGGEKDDLCSISSSSGCCGSSRVIVGLDLGAGKRRRYLRGSDLGLGAKVSETDWYSPKGSESLEFECDRDATWETVSASDLVPESRAGGSDSSKRIFMSFKTNPSKC